MVNSFQVNGVLPAANSCDITKADGYKNYQLRNACVTSFGTLYNNSVPRFIQFGVKVCF